jgi:radical SAM/Cys-rich protein
MTTTTPTTTPLSISARDRFNERVVAQTGDHLRPATIDTFQVNIGLICNLACHHCHVESSPKRDEQMTWATMQSVLAAAREARATTLDITGGAPEMNPHFRRFVTAARAQNLDVIVRTNLTIMLVDGYTDLPEFYRDQRVRLVASLPCYLEENVDKQRGKHVYHDSIEVIQKLNAVGYGLDDTGLELDLVYNPGGPSLPPETTNLEAAYKYELRERYGIVFNHLFAITNMPIGRFAHDLQRDGHAQAYEQLLRDSFNPQTLDGLMCRHHIHISHDGALHDCDFNYALGMSAHPDPQNTPRHINDFTPDTWLARRVATADHCFGCTAGSGSSCGGALAE